MARMSGGIKELKLWQEAVALAGEVVRLVRAASKRETTVLTDPLVLAASNVAVRVAAGYTHPEVGGQRALYLDARAALVETETLLAIGRHSGVIATDAVLALNARAGAVHRLLAGYLAYVDRQLAESLGVTQPGGPAHASAGGIPADVATARGTAPL